VKAACVNNERDFTCPVLDGGDPHTPGPAGRKIRDEPTEGALVRAVCVVLTRRRAQRVWRGVLLRTTFYDDVRREALCKGPW
jgi:hypothetical protein